VLGSLALPRSGLLPLLLLLALYDCIPSPGEAAAGRGGLPRSDPLRLDQSLLVVVLLLVVVVVVVLKLLKLMLVACLSRQCRRAREGCALRDILSRWSTRLCNGDGDGADSAPANSGTTQRGTRRLTVATIGLVA
jgi:hypothetical protein